MFTLSFSSSDLVHSQASPKRRKASVSWKNRTSGSFYSAPRVVPLLKPHRIHILKPSKLDYRPLPLLHFPVESDTRAILGKRLYIERGDAIRYLSEMFSASRAVVMSASILMLRRWIFCYEREANKAVVSRWL